MKFTQIFLIIVFILILSGCGEKIESTNDSTQISVQITEPTQEKEQLEQDELENVIVLTEQNSDTIIEENTTVNIQLDSGSSKVVVKSDVEVIRFNGDNNIVVVPDGSDIEIQDNGEGNVVYFK